MNHVKALAAACLAAFMALVLGLLVIAAMAGAQSADGAGGGAISAAGGALKAGAVRAAYALWIQRAGALCAAVPPALLAAQIQQESGFDPNALSPAGAEGIAQFMPGTWPTWGRDDDGTGRVSPYNAADAIMAMGRYDCALSAQVARVPGDPVANMLAAYNAGPGAVLQYNGVPPFAETQQYVADIQALIVTYAAAPASVTGAAGFAQREIQAASRYLGAPYVWGGGSYAGPTAGLGGTSLGFDCSGLVLYAVYQASGGAIRLPHLADDQARLGAPVAPGDLRPGDVIAFKLNGSAVYDHIVIYAGNGQVITAPETGESVRMQSLASFGGVPTSMRRFG
jgi:cell wall-associated NlpC family hydrolase